MPTRRDLLKFLAAGVAAPTGASAAALQAAGTPKIKALAFDAFPILDPRPIFSLAEQLFPGRGAELSSAWRTRQFEYQWLRTLSRRYANFESTTEGALVFAARALRLELTPEKRRQLLASYFQLKAWPDAAGALGTLRKAGLRIGFLSNATAAILEAGIKNSRLEAAFEQVLSTDSIGTYKPDPRAYRMALDAFQLSVAEICFVAFAGWDAAGAKSFGFTTFWVNRLSSPPEELGATADGVGQGLDDLLAFLGM